MGRACARANGHARRVDAFGGQLGKAVVRPYVRRRRSEDREAPQAAIRESDGQRAWPPPLQQLQHASTGWGVHARPRRRLTRAPLGLQDKRSSRIAQARLHSRARVTTVHTHADCTSLTISDRLTLNFSLYLTAKPHFRPTARDICPQTLHESVPIFVSTIPLTKSRKSKLSGSPRPVANTLSFQLTSTCVVGGVGGAFAARRKGGRAFLGFTSEAADLLWKRLAGGCAPTALGPFARAG